MAPFPLATSSRGLSRPEVPSLATAIDLFTADVSHTPGHRRRARSSLRLMAKAAGGPPEQIPANLAVLRSRTAGFHPEHAGVSRKRWQNVRSETASVLKYLDLTGPGVLRHKLVLPAWRHLLDGMRDAGLVDWHLGRLSRCCSALGIAPEGVSDATLLLFRQALVKESQRNDPDRVVRRTAKMWNKARRLVPGWPAVELTVTGGRPRVWLPLDAFPAPFQEDLATFLERIGSRTPFRQGRPDRPAAPATLRNRRHQVRALASALVYGGVPPVAITSLAALVIPEHIRLALDFMWRRNKEKPSSYIHGHATALLAIAKYHAPIGAEGLEELREVAAGLIPKRRGMAEKNRRRLRQLNDERNKALLLHLPRCLQAEAEARGELDRRGALLMQMAVAIELLLMCMIRRENLVSLDANRHFRWSRAGRAGVCHLAIAAEEVKNGEPLDFELPQEAADLLRLYLDRYQRLLGNTPSSWLFPGRTGQAPKNESGFSTQITDCVFKHTGIELHPHLFRHIGAKLHLDACPGSYEVLRRVLRAPVDEHHGPGLLRPRDDGRGASRGRRDPGAARSHAPLAGRPPRAPSRQARQEGPEARPMTERRATCRRFEAWPEEDELAWTGILRPGSPFDKAGRGARWSAATRDLYRRDYDYWLRFRHDDGQLRVEASPASRVTPEAVSAYLASLEGLADHTVRLLLEGLLVVCRAIAPYDDWTWFRVVVDHLRRQRLQRRPKHPRLRDSADLLEAGLVLMEEAEKEEAALQRAATYRDGLMLATLAARPLRRRNLGMIELGRHLVRCGPGWQLVFAGHETKTGTPFELPWPGRLEAPLERYLDRHRPVLLAGQAGDRLWIGQRARPMGGRTIHKRVTGVTRRLFGQPINPHLFRDCFATSIAIRDPGHIRVAAILLGHSQRTNERHYNQAQTIEAGRLYQQEMLALRLQLAPASPSSQSRLRRQRR